jgi:ferredoxin
MANKSDKWKENVNGKFYVDQACISCDACVCAAPTNFKMDDENGHAFVTKQPATPEEEEACREAMEGCPVEAIGNDGDS